MRLARAYASMTSPPRAKHISQWQLIPVMVTNAGRYGWRHPDEIVNHMFCLAFLLPLDIKLCDILKEMACGTSNVTIIFAKVRARSKTGGTVIYLLVHFAVTKYIDIIYKESFINYSVCNNFFNTVAAQKDHSRNVPLHI